MPEWIIETRMLPPEDALRRCICRAVRLHSRGQGSAFTLAFPLPRMDPSRKHTHVCGVVDTHSSATVGRPPRPPRPPPPNIPPSAALLPAPWDHIHHHLVQLAPLHQPPPRNDRRANAAAERIFRREHSSLDDPFRHTSRSSTRILPAKPRHKARCKGRVTRVG